MDGRVMPELCLLLSTTKCRRGKLRRFVSQTLKPSGIEAIKKGQRRYESAKNKRIGTKSMWVAVRSPDLFPTHTHPTHTPKQILPFYPGIILGCTLWGG